MKRIGMTFALLPMVGHGGSVGRDSTDLTGATIGGAAGAGVGDVVDQVSD